MRGWNVPENSTRTVYEYTTLKTHLCTDVELGFAPPKNDEEAKFFAIDDEQFQDARRMIGAWYCLDDE